MKTRLYSFLKPLSIIIISIFFLASIVHAGDLTSPGAPIMPTSYTLTDIFNRLTTGGVATEGDHSLVPTGPLAPTMHSLKEIYDAIPDLLSLSDTSETVPVGLNLTPFNLSDVDPDLVDSNIASGVDIFGITGTLTGGGSSGSTTILKTGQTLCYESGGTQGSTAGVIPCAGTGQDGDTLLGTDREYENKGDGTVLDISTGLMWKRCTEGLSGDNCETGTPNDMAWLDALSTCKALDYAGHTDWKLPNINELTTIVDYAPADPNPPINATYFPHTPYSKYFWSSTQEIYSRPGAWATDTDGQTSTHALQVSNHVRCVRVETSGAPAQPLKTGQTLCYDGDPFGDGLEIPCAGTGQDGEYQSGVDRSYTNNGDGTISDNTTGLMWQRCPFDYIGTDCDNFDPNSVPYDTFSDAKDVCDAADTGGYTDWRLPSVNELKSLMDYHRFDFVQSSGDRTAIDPIYFPHDSGDYISSTVGASAASYGFFFEWTPSNDEGYAFSSPGYDLIMCVR